MRENADDERIPCARDHAGGDLPQSPGASSIELRNDFAREKWKLRLAGDAHAADRKAVSDSSAQIQDQIRGPDERPPVRDRRRARENEAGLREGIENCQAAREHFENIARAFAAFSAFLRGRRRAQDCGRRRRQDRLTSRRARPRLERARPFRSPASGNASISSPSRRRRRPATASATGGAA